MNFFQNKIPYTMFLVFAFLFLILAIIVSMFSSYLILVFLALQIILALVLLIIIIRRQQEQTKVLLSVEEFEKRLKGGLYHFKCPSCGGIFAIKKSRGNNKKIVKMTCPDCGKVGFIIPNPRTIREEIPQKKSVKANFSCGRCGEGITVWAEGADLYKNVSVYSCPFCGTEKPLRRL